MILFSLRRDWTKLLAAKYEEKKLVSGVFVSVMHTPHMLNVPKLVINQITQIILVWWYYV